MANAGKWLLDYIRQNENTTQRALLEAAEKAHAGSDRTLRGYIARLDGVMIKRVREGREVRLQSIEYWRRQEHQTFDLRVPHTAKLKAVLDQFRSQLPFVGDLGLQTVPPVEYRPDLRVDFENHLLFDDLLFHLGLLKLRVDPATAWPEFKREASRFIAARDALWSRCVETASEALGLPFGNNWSGDVVSDNCVRLFYDRALSAVRGEKETADPFQDAKVVPVGDVTEYWLGGRGILRRRLAEPKTPAELTKQLARALRLAERAEFRKLAEPVANSVKLLRSIREGLDSALAEASYHEVFPGACRFTGAT